MTKLDILDDFDEVKIGVEYQLNGKVLNYHPSSLSELSTVEVSIDSYDVWASGLINILIVNVFVV